MSFRTKIALIITGAFLIVAGAILAILVGTGTLRFFAAPLPQGTSAKLSPTTFTLPSGATVFSTKIILNAGATGAIDGYTFNVAFDPKKITIVNKDKVTFLKPGFVKNINDSQLTIGKVSIVGAYETPPFPFALNSTTEVISIEFQVIDFTGTTAITLTGNLAEGANRYDISDSVTYALGAETGAVQVVFDPASSNIESGLAKLNVDLKIIPGTNVKSITAFSTNLRWNAALLKLSSITNKADNAVAPTGAQISTAQAAESGDVILTIAGAFTSAKTIATSIANLVFDVKATSGFVYLFQDLPVTVNGTIPATSGSGTYQIGAAIITSTSTNTPITPTATFTTVTTVATPTTLATLANTPTVTTTSKPKVGDFAKYGLATECAPRNSGCLLAMPDGTVDGADLLYFFQYLYKK